MHFVLVFGFALLPHLVVSKITWIEAKFPIGGTPSPPGSPWPYPQTMSSTTTLLTIDPASFTIHSNAETCDIIKAAMDRYKNHILILGSEGKADLTPSMKKLKSVELQVVKFAPPNDCGYPKLGDNETYSIEVKNDNEKAIISAQTVWGALRGLETFSQLVFVDEIKQTYYINETSIKDFPTFGYRGVLLDTARHFQPMKVLKQNLEAMSYNKFNVFHWHIVDDQSWPFESKIYPNLTVKGAYHPRLVYTQTEMKDIIAYARLRGIRVMPEFDTPGHTLGLGKAFPGVITPCYGESGKPFTPNYTEHADMEILNPSLPKTYELVKTIFKEFKSVFPDEYVHVGMDEVYYACWNSNPDIQKFMADNNITSLNKLEQYYVAKTLQNVKDVGYKYMTWQDPVDNGVEMDKDVIVQMWKDVSLDSKLKPWHDYIRNISKKGYKMVVSACWYLNYISYGMDWKKYYDCDPRGFDADDSVKDLVIGGEACMWGEYVDATNIIARLWPRASAVAERLWSSAAKNDTDEAQYRLDEQRCRMLRRGLPTQPILNGFCGDYEWDLDGDTDTSTTIDNTDTSTMKVPDTSTINQVTSDSTSSGDDTTIIQSTTPDSGDSLKPVVLFALLSFFINVLMN